MNYYEKQRKEALERLKALLARPFPQDNCDIGTDGTFDPWELFPAIYGTYCGDFDKCAIEVLSELIGLDKHRYDLASEMFREMLCTGGFCEYGTSPRACFPTQGFKELLPDLIAKWKAFSLLHWGGDVCAQP